MGKMKKYYVDGQQITEAEAQAIVEKNNEIFARCRVSGGFCEEIYNIKFVVMFED
jgi:hypothetical protein